MTERTLVLGVLGLLLWWAVYSHVLPAARWTMSSVLHLDACSAVPLFMQRSSALADDGDEVISERPDRNARRQDV